ncbi:hypothetical protein Syun_007564 [Stephania yunnanensis]|uniref:Uncharacterized protein n=1 Tax=Stephania yunnanensis TaxID=152371 RepID=A0AAP0L072_9MAGN
MEILEFKWLNFVVQVWSLTRRFDQPQRYKLFVSRCVEQGGVNIGSVKEVSVKIGLPATTSTGRLELLNEEEHILGIRIVGGDHRLKKVVNGGDPRLRGCIGTLEARALINGFKDYALTSTHTMNRRSNRPESSPKGTPTIIFLASTSLDDCLGRQLVAFVERDQPLFDQVINTGVLQPLLFTGACGTTGAMNRQGGVIRGSSHPFCGATGACGFPMWSAIIGACSSLDE